MKNYIAQVAYDGTNYLGWQKTQEGPSIEEEIEKVLSLIFQHPISLQAASRTDRGVHAEGQIINWLSEKTFDPPKLLASLNKLLPSDIQILGITNSIDNTFHPTLDTSGKEYLYRISTGPIQLPRYRWTHWHVPSPLDRGKIESAFQYLVGKHDFKSFCNSRKNMKYESTVRNLSSISLSQMPHEIVLSIQGDHFLYKMARNIVGTLVYIGLGKLDLQAIPDSYESKSRPLLGITAPAHGLCLKEIFYEKWPQLYKCLKTQDRVISEEC